MADIVKGLVEGGWALLVGWILPALLDVLLFALIVYPSIKGSPPFSVIPASDISLVIAAVVVGVVLSALKTPLYQILEGYILWPLWLFKWGQRRQIRHRSQLVNILNYAHYSEAKRGRDEAERLMNAAENQSDRTKTVAMEELESATKKFGQWDSAGVAAREWLENPANIRVKPWHIRKATADERAAHGFAMKIWNRRPRRQTVVARATDLPILRRRVLAARLERYPTSEEEILPTVLGNAIHRFEKFGPVHYGLDQQRLWYELMATAPERVGQQVDRMRTAVDFFVSLLYGQLLVAIAAVATISFDLSRVGWLGIGALVAVMIAILSYRGAVVTTDEWCFAVQALLNVGRKPLADALSLTLPRDLATEQDMWRSVTRFLRPKPRHEAFNQLNRYRIEIPPPDKPKAPSGPP
jgi:hypothetical protein